MDEQDVSKFLQEVPNLLKSLLKEGESNTLLFEILVEELKGLTLENQQKLILQADLLQLYRDIHENLTQEEKDNFFLCYLRGIQGIADEGRGRLREIVRRYITDLSSTTLKKLTRSHKANEPN